MGGAVLRAILDTSVLISEPDLPPGLATAISVFSLSELHFGVLVARNETKRRERLARLGSIEARFPRPLPLDSRVARVLGQFEAAVAQRGGNPRARLADLAIAATAAVYGAVLVTANPKDLKHVRDLVTVRVLADPVT